MTHCIPEEQRRVHVTAEAIAIVVMVPFMFYLTAQRRLPAWARVAALGFGVGTMVIDGLLLARNLRRKDDPSVGAFSDGLGSQGRGR